VILPRACLHCSTSSDNSHIVRYASRSAGIEQTATRPHAGGDRTTCTSAPHGSFNHANHAGTCEGDEGQVVGQEDVRWVCGGQEEGQDIYHLLEKPEA